MYVNGYSLILDASGIMYLIFLLHTKKIDIVCNDEILGKDHTLKFVLVTKWKDKVSFPVCRV